MSEQEQSSNPGHYPGTGQYPGIGSYPGSDQYPGTGAKDSVALSELANTLWRRKLIIFITAGIAALAAALLALADSPAFIAKGRVLLGEATPSGGILGKRALLAGGRPALAEIEVVQSRKIVNRVVSRPSEDALGLDLSIKVDDWDLYGPWNSVKRKWTNNIPQGSLAAELVDPAPSRNNSFARITFSSPNRGEIRWDRLWAPESSHFVLEDGPVTFGNVSIRLFPEGNLAGRTFRLHWTTPRHAAEILLKSLSVKETRTGSGVLLIGHKDTDPNRTASVVNNVIAAYIDHSQERLSLRAGKTVLDIESQIERVQDGLEEAERELVQFNAAVLSDTAHGVVRRMSTLDLEQAKLSMLIEDQNRLVKMIDQGAAAEEVGAGAELDPQTISMLRELRGLVSEALAISGNHTEEWLPLIQLRAQISQLRVSVSAAAHARAAALQRNYNSLGSALARWQNQLNNLPATERELAKFQRRAQSFENIYTYLLARERAARREEELGELVSVVDYALPPIVVDYALPPMGRFRPNLTVRTLIGLILGLFAGAAIGLWRDRVKLFG